VVRPAEVIQPAVRDNAPSIIVVHNHPSGDPTPSAEDVAITRELVSAGKLMGVELLDHVVIGNGNRYVSLNEKRLGFN
jgi:DNA repair protein RadC